SSAADNPAPADDASVRRLDDGREFTIVKVYYEPAALEAALRRAGFDDARVTTTGRFFLTGVARARRGYAQGPSAILRPMSPLATSTIATVGSGVMAEAMIAGMLRGKL